MSGGSRHTRHGETAISVGPNEVLRFVLELASLAALAYSGWALVGGGLSGALLGGGLSIGAAAAWGIFRVDGDPKPAPVPVRGAVRLLIEAAFFGVAIGLLIAAGRDSLGLALGSSIVAHYAIGYRRITWLWKHPGRL